MTLITCISCKYPQCTPCQKKRVVLMHSGNKIYSDLRHNFLIKWALNEGQFSITNQISGPSDSVSRIANCESSLASKKKYNSFKMTWKSKNIMNNAFMIHTKLSFSALFESWWIRHILSSRKHALPVQLLNSMNILCTQPLKTNKVHQIFIMCLFLPTQNYRNTDGTTT